ncbi:MAG: tandem-95 repeat protein [Actinobacteria bacterium]|nr:tandem-95 repeat protein [Actinomycetota bacterium]
MTLSNDAPDAVDDAYSTDEDTALTVNAPGVLANDTDPQGDAPTAAVATGPANGTLGVNADGSFTYTPNANFNGADSFTYTATDSLGASDTATVAITVNPVNDAPVATGESYTHYGSDTALVVIAPGVLANDSDPVEGSPLTAVLVSGPASGTLTLNPNGSFTYQPNEDFGGTDSFTYKANDGAADSNVVTVSIIVGAGCRGRQATRVGTSGADRLTGTKNADVIAGLGGNDIINGNAGNDVICGGSGNDTLNAGAGDDYADGGSGDDKVKGEVGNDTVLGGAGADAVNGDDGNDVLSGGAGTPDACQAGAGTADSLAPDHGCETISGIP